MQLKGKKIIFLGDSITEGVGVSSIDKRYADVFANITEVESYMNYGISATRIARQQKIQDEYVDTHAFTERFEHMDEDADIVVVFGGTNDYGHGDAPFGMLGDRTNESYCGALLVSSGSLFSGCSGCLIYAAPAIVSGTTFPFANSSSPPSASSISSFRLASFGL